MQSVLQDLSEKFEGRIRFLESTGEEIYASVEAGDLRDAAAWLRDQHSARLATVLAEDRRIQEGVFYNYYVFDRPGDPSFLLLRLAIPQGEERFPSLAAELPAVNWQEREIQDWFGLEAEGHPNPRRVALHDNWPDVHPLRKEFALYQELPSFEGEQHVYRPTLGEGVFQVPVGPVHAGIIEPGHFNFAVAGEPILYLQLRMFYKHKGTEKLFEELPVERAVFLAESISGDSAASHAAAFCQAVEKAAGAEVPERALIMRSVVLELERLYNHIGDIGAIATDVGFGVANAHAGRVREMVLDINEELAGNRLLRGLVCLGGVRRNWTGSQVDLLRRGLDKVEPEFEDLIRLIRTSDSTRDRLEHTGRLLPEKAWELGIVGVGGRASGIDRDVRRDHPYAAYGSLTFRIPVFDAGDVWHRLKVRVEEVRASIEVIRALAEHLPHGDFRAAMPALPPDRCALSAVEGWRGEILHWVRTGADNRLERCKIKDPSLNNWPALVEAVQGNIIADFPVINKSFNLSYSGTDR